MKTAEQAFREYMMLYFRSEHPGSIHWAIKEAIFIEGWNAAIREINLLRLTNGSKPAKKGPWNP